MSGKRMKMRSVGFAVAAGAVVLLAACGSSTSTASPAAQPSATSTAPTSASGTVIMAASNSKLGTVLVSSAGKTVYTLTNATGKAVPCTGQCLTFWPPVLLPAGATTATGSAGVTGLATVMTTGGTQVSASGLPLYTFSGDSSAGDANGQGVSSFGGTWHVVTTSASPSGASSPTPTPAPATTPTTSGYNY